MLLNECKVKCAISKVVLSLFFYYKGLICVDLFFYVIQSFLTNITLLSAESYNFVNNIIKFLKGDKVIWQDTSTNMTNVFCEALHLKKLHRSRNMKKKTKLKTASQ